MSKWNEVQLGDLVDIRHGHPYQGRDFSDSPTPLVAVTPGNFSINGGFCVRKLRYYRGEYRKKHVLNPGDILLAMTDLSRLGDTLGAPARVPQLPGVTFLHNQRIGRIVNIKTRIHKDFLYWRLRHPDFRLHVLNSASGTTVKHTAPKRILSFRFKLPPIARQREIVALLECYEAAIHTLDQQTDVLEQMIMTIFNQWFQDRLFPCDGQSSSPVVDWPEAPLKDFGKIVCGQTPSRKLPHYFDGSVPFIKIPDMRHCVFVTHTADTLSELGARAQPRKLIPPNAVCISTIATIGLVALTSDWSHTNQQINTLIPHRYWTRYYLYCRLKTMEARLRRQAGGGTSLPNISTGMLKNITIPHPPEALLRQFHRRTAPLFSRILVNHRQSRETRRLLTQLIGDLLCPEGHHVRQQYETYRV